MIGSRDAGKPELGEWLAADGAGIEAGTFAETAAHGDLLVLAVLGNAAEKDEIAFADGLSGIQVFQKRPIPDARLFHEDAERLVQSGGAKFEAAGRWFSIANVTP